MSQYFDTVKEYLLEMGFYFDQEDESEELVVINDEEKGIKNCVIDCEDPIVIIEQMIMTVPKDDKKLYKRLLQINRNIVCGAFVLDEDGKWIIFRDTLQLANLDKNELEGSINSLSLALAEHAGELLSFAKK